MSQQSPMGARILAGRLHHKAAIRLDWPEIQLEVMAYCIRAKLVWHWVGFGTLLRETAGRDIVENSSKTDAFWGVVPAADGCRGMNHLGRLLMGLRDEYLSEDNEVLHRLTPPELDLRLGGEALKVIDRRKQLMRLAARRGAEVDHSLPCRLPPTAVPNPGKVAVPKQAVAHS